MSATQYEFRVRWTRDDWAPTSTSARIYQREAAAHMFAKRIAADGATVVSIETRPVGKWADQT